ncbi:MAG TPA: LamG-like jellyroll fold domain-containing protein, partial [Longimicrobiales bacterium]|nr:LamG-like jellyroll fold domain-containing protein [Longimicrobiales bacterium]
MSFLVIAGCASDRGVCTLQEDEALVGPGVDLAPLPDPERWLDVGLVLDAGGFGAWDAFMEGYTPSSVILLDGSFYLYYVGADDYIPDLRNIGPSHRSLGVAVSQDGIRWSKPLDRPVITFSSSGNPEEGAVSGGIFVDGDGTVLAYYGANFSEDSTTADVQANVHLATSPDGLRFSPEGRVIDHLRAVPFRLGDEIHATAAFKYGDEYFVYFVPNGGPYSGTLRYCRGPGPASLTDCGEAHRTGGATSVVRIGDDTFAVFVVTRGTARVYRVPGRCLTQLGEPIETFSIQGQAKFALDPARRTWLMYYDQWRHVGLMVAPAGPPDSTPPGRPGNLGADPVDHAGVRLSWDPAADSETGVLRYEVYRDGALVGSTLEEAFELADLEENRGYLVEVRAVNLHGFQGTGSRIAIRTPFDSRPPLARAVTAVARDTVEVRFDEAIARSAGSDRTRFSIDQGVVVLEAAVGDSAHLIRLVTTPMQVESEYSLSYEVVDGASRGNTGSGEVSFTTSVAPRLIGYWPFDGARPPGVDRSGSGHVGTMSANWSEATPRASGTLRFDGEVYLEIQPTALLDEAFESQFAVSAWVRPEQLPTATDNTDGAHLIFSTPTPWRLLYRHDGRFIATVESIAEPIVTSEAYRPGEWHHIALVGNRAAGSLSLFVDGGEV